MTKLITAYRFDAEGWYIGTDQVMPGQVPKDDTLEAPPLKDGYWCRWDGTSWEYVQIPTTAEEFVDAGIVVDHQSHTKHSEELRKLMRGLKCDGKPGGFRLDQESGTNNLSIVQVPELTAAEEQLQQDEAEDNALNSQIYALRERMAYAQLIGDEDLIAEIQAEYRTLMGIEED